MQKRDNTPGKLWLAVLTVTLGLGSATSAWSAITDGVVAYWNFDNGDFKDSVGLNGVKFDGTQNGSAPITFEAGKGGFGQAMRLDGVDQFVEITGGAEDDLAFPGGSMSIAGWFTVGTFDKSWQALIAKGEGSNWRVHRNGANSTMAYAGGIGEGPNDGPAIDDGGWHHFVAVSDLDAVNFGTVIYIDGVKTSINSGTPSLGTNGKRVMIGENPDARNRYWNGLVDDLAIWNRVLTDSDVADLYFSGAGKPLSSFYGAHVDRIVTTKGASEPDNVQVQILDDGTSVFDPTASGNLNVTVDGVATVPATKSKTGTVSLLNFTNQFYASASKPQVNVEAKDTKGGWTTNQLTFVIPTYPTIPTDYKLAAPATTPGMVAANIYQIDYARVPSTDENATGSAEQQLARGFPVNGGTPYPSVAAQGSDNTVTVVNWARLNDLTGDYDITATPANGPDNFNSARPTTAPIANVSIPGLPGTGNDQGHGGADANSAWDNIVVETVTYLQLKRGAYLMGVNSDDGFKVTTSPGAEDPFGLQLGQFSGGRGAANSTFWFVAQEDGYYPFRLLWWQGAGGANVEWFVTDRATGTKFLVNDAASPIKAFRQGVARAHVKSILPADGFTGANTNSPIKIVLVDDSTTVVDGSISLTVDGSPVTPTINNGATTTVTYTGGLFDYITKHTGQLVWSESTSPPTVWTNNFTFSVRSQEITELPANSFWIEAEDFNHDGGQTEAAASTMPYAGNAYDQLSAIVDIDYQRPQETSSDLYRIGETPNVPMNPNETAGTLAIQRPGGFEVATNFKMGWTAGGAWYNYTRTIPAGLYTAFDVVSHGDVGADVGGSLQRVTAGATTTSQTVVQLGTFNGPAPGGWGANTLVPLRNAQGAPGVFKLPGGPVTIRMTTRNGDYDWFTLVPVAGVAPQVTSASPAGNSAVRRDAVVNFTIEDFSTAVNTNTVKLFFDGADVTSSATITKPADITTVTYDPPGLMDIASSHSYKLIFSDNGAPAVSQTNTASFTAQIYPTPGSFLIEAEDFNHTGGQTVAAASTMPYLGGVYTNLGAVLGVDYNDSDGRDSQPYRSSGLGNGLAGQNVNHDPNATAGTLDTDRGEWSVTANYKIGWTGAGNWYNYTRTVPAGAYQIWAALSFDGTAAGQLQGSVDRVAGDVTTTNQTLTSLGTFNAPGSGGWGANNLVPLKDGSGNIVVTSLGGPVTLRFNASSGDYDYLMLVPGVAPLQIASVTIASGQVTVTWTGTGTLYSTSSLTTPVTWTTTGDSDGSHTAAVGTGNVYFRVQGP